MTRAPQAWLVCYDIADDNRRTAVYHTCRGYGEHLQFSVFRCVVSPRQFAELRAKLEDIAHARKDQILLVPLGSPDEAAFKAWIAIGQAVQAVERTVVIL